MQKHRRATVAVANRNSAYCPDRPLPEGTETNEIGVPPTRSQLAGSSLRRAESTGTPSASTQPTLFALSTGISTWAMAAQELGLEVLGCIERDEQLAMAFAKRTGAKAHADLRTMIDEGKQGKHLSLIHI